MRHGNFATAKVAKDASSVHRLINLKLQIAGRHLSPRDVAANPIDIRRSRLVATIGCCSLMLAASGHADSATAAMRIAKEQRLAELIDSHAVRGKPSNNSKRLTVVKARRPITGVRTTLPVIATSKDNQSRRWLRVRLPGRVLNEKPPPRTGWIRATRTRRTSAAWHLVVDVDDRQVAVYRDGRRQRTFEVIVGAPETPTPLGKFFVEENVLMPEDEPGAPYALALSARSNVLQEFAGGPGQVALHGLSNVGGELGTAVSHGCVRLDNSAIKWLATRIGLGAPVTIF